jgi:hypothetical protein
MKAGRIKVKVASSHPRTDRRILRTRDALGDALVALMQEKKFDEITVQDVPEWGVQHSTYTIATKMICS